MLMTAELLERLRMRLKVTEPKVTEVVERLVAAGHPQRVVAFGSRVRGDATPDSDLDLAVVLDRVDPDKPAVVGSWVLAGIDLDVDLLVTDTKWFETHRKFNTSVHFDIDREGLVLYDRARDAGPNRDAIAKISLR
jgi:predicted nucleotidyltransferase